MNERPHSRPAPQTMPNRLGVVVGELSDEQKKGLGLDNGLVVLEVRPGAKADLRKGDVLLTMVHKGRQSRLKTVEQFDRLLAGLEKNAVMTLQVRRGETTAFVSISGLPGKG
jgi:serine protease Do